MKKPLECTCGRERAKHTGLDCGPPLPEPPLYESTTDRQRAIDISNLRLYARLARENEWPDAIIHWSVFEQTLNEIADRLEAL